MSHNPSDGILDRLKNARTQQDVEELLDEAEDYEDASDDTRNRWRKAAKRRRDELEGEK